MFLLVSLVSRKNVLLSYLTFVVLLFCLQVQCTAIRCIQKNIRCYLSVNKWPWWRLYTKVKNLNYVLYNNNNIKIFVLKLKYEMVPL